MNNKKAIIAGGGLIPELVVNKLRSENISYYLVALNNFFDSSNIIADIFIDIGSVGKLLKILCKENISEIIFAGKVSRPSFSSLKIDKEGAKLLAIITAKKITGDDNILKSIINFFEEKNFKIIKTSDILDNILAKQSCLTNLTPDQNDYKNIEIAKNLLNIIGDFDIGQACVIENGLILGIEGPEGTDQLIKRCKFLKKESKSSAILVKIKKPNQEEKIDLPTIGKYTIDNVIDAGFKGIAIGAGYSFILDQEEIIKEVNKHNIFIIGI